MAIGGGDAIPVPDIRGGCAVESHDGKFLYHDGDFKGNYALWRVPTSGGPENLVVDTLHAEAGQVVVDQGVYFISKPDENRLSHIKFKDFTTGLLQTIVAIPGVVDWGLAVSPDRRSFLFCRDDGSGSDLMLVENFR
jgi:hypothetical protein